MHPRDRSTRRLIVLAVGFVAVSAAAATERAATPATPHLQAGAYPARMAVAQESPYATGRPVHPAIVRLAPKTGGRGAWTLSIRIFHDTLRPETHEDLILEGPGPRGPFVAVHPLRRGFYSLYYGLPERLRLESGALTSSHEGTPGPFTLTLRGQRSGRTYELGMVTPDRALGSVDPDPLAFDPHRNGLLRPVGLAATLVRAIPRPTWW